MWGVGVWGGCEWVYVCVGVCRWVCVGVHKMFNV